MPSNPIPSPMQSFLILSIPERLPNLGILKRNINSMFHTLLCIKFFLFSSNFFFEDPSLLKLSSQMRGLNPKMIMSFIFCDNTKILLTQGFIIAILVYSFIKIICKILCYCNTSNETVSKK